MIASQEKGTRGGEGGGHKINNIDNSKTSTNFFLFFHVAYF